MLSGSSLTLEPSGPAKVGAPGSFEQRQAEDSYNYWAYGSAGTLAATMMVVGGAAAAEASAGNAARGGGGASTTLYRGVGPNELADLRQVGQYRVAAGGAEGKYFFKTPEQVSNFARMMGDKAYTTTSVEVSPVQLARGQAVNPAGEGPGYFFPTGNLPTGSVSIFNFSVLP
jgi:hypothetical protein